MSAAKKNDATADAVAALTQERDTLLEERATLTRERDDAIEAAAESERLRAGALEIEIEAGRVAAARIAELEAQLASAQSESAAARTYSQSAVAEALDVTRTLQAEVDTLRAKLDATDPVASTSSLGSVSGPVLLLVGPTVPNDWIARSSPKARGYVVDFTGPSAALMVARVKQFKSSTLPDGTIRIAVADQQAADAVAHEAKRWLTDNGHPGTVTVHPANGSELAATDAVRGAFAGAFPSGVAIKGSSRSARLERLASGKERVVIE